MSTLRQLQDKGFYIHDKVAINKKEHFTFNLLTSAEQIVFLTTNKNGDGEIRQFINQFKEVFRFYILLEEDNKYYWQTNSFEGLKEIELDKFIEQITDSDNQIANTLSAMNSFEDTLKIEFSQDKDITLTDGSRFIRREGEWQEAYSIEESNEYFHSLLFYGPLGFHFLKYRKGIRDYFKFLLYLFTGGIYGITLLDGIFLLLLGKKESGKMLPFSQEESRIWIAPERSKLNWKKLAIALPYTIVIALLMFGVMYLGFNLLISLAETIADSLEKII